MDRTLDFLYSAGRLIAVALALWLAPTTAPAATLTCGAITIEAEDPATAVRVCATVTTAAPRLAECGLVQTRPLTIALIDLVKLHDTQCLALFDCTQDKIEITNPDALPDLLARTPEPLRLMAPDPLFDSLIVHELAHALYQMTIDGRLQSPANHEYVAYAMQMQTLPPDQREILLKAHPVTGTVDPMAMNEMIAAAAPMAFASRVWHHFSASENGCGFIADLISGQADLALGMP